MSTTQVSVCEAPGTKVHFVKRNACNPARKFEDIKLFRNGYWEILFSSTGENPDFPRGSWKILLVAISQPTIEFEIDTDSRLLYVPISSSARPAEIKTHVHCFQLDEQWWRFPALIISLDNKRVVKIQCDVEEMIQNTAIN